MYSPCLCQQFSDENKRYIQKMLYVKYRYMAFMKLIYAVCFLLKEQQWRKLVKNSKKTQSDCTLANEEEFTDGTRSTRHTEHQRKIQVWPSVNTIISHPGTNICRYEAMGHREKKGCSACSLSVHNSSPIFGGQWQYLSSHPITSNSSSKSCRSDASIVPHKGKMEINSVTNRNLKKLVK